MPSGIVVHAASTDVLARVDPDAVALTAGERQRAAALRRPGDRADFLAAHLLVRACAAAVLEVAVGAVDLVQRCVTCGGPHGRPQLAGSTSWQLSMTHTTGHVAAAVAAGPVGVDMELDRPETSDRATRLATSLSPGEQRLLESAAAPARAFLRLWVRKETLLKAGVGDVDRLAELDVAALSLPVGAAPARGELNGLSFVEWTLPTAAGTVVAAAAAPSPLNLIAWPELPVRDR